MHRLGKRRRMNVAIKLLQVNSFPTVVARAGSGYGVTFQGTKTDVHKTLISATKVQSEGHAAVVDSNGGYIILTNSTLARKIQQFTQNETVNELGAIRLYLENGAHIGYTENSASQLPSCAIARNEAANHAY